MSIDRSLAHDVRGVLAAAASNLEYVRAHEISTEVRSAVTESLHELRLVADVIALLATTEGRAIEVDFRAALMLHRGAIALGIDATEPLFLVRAPPAAIHALASTICGIAARARVRTDGSACSIDPVDPDGARALLGTAALSESGLRGELNDRVLVLSASD